MTQRRLHLCADDFGLSPAISQGISRLAAAARLSAVSCITNSAHWPVAAASLRTWPGTVEVGLHFNLTEGHPLSPELARVWPVLPALPKLMALAHLRRLPMEALRREWQAQVDAFTQLAGRLPQMVDGHQHVHHLPGLRDIVLQGVEQLTPRPAVRSTGRLLAPGFAFKRQVIEGTGGRALLRELQRRGLRHNAALLGVYDFSASGYRGLMQQWLVLLPLEGGLLFCHPGETAIKSEIDPIAAARVRERAYFDSDAFNDDLARADVVLGPAWVCTERTISGTSRPD